MVMICLFIYEIYDTFTHSWLVAYTHNTLGIIKSAMQPLLQHPC